MTKHLVTAKGVTAFYTVNCREKPSVESNIIRQLDSFGTVLNFEGEFDNWNKYSNLEDEFYIRKDVISYIEFKPNVKSILYYNQNDAQSKKYPNDCGAASALMMINYENSYDKTVDQIATEMGIVGSSFSSISQIMSIAKKYNTNLKYIRPFYLTDVLLNTPSLVLLNYGELYHGKNYGHFLVVIGYDEYSVITHDPNTKAYQHYDLRKFGKALAQYNTNQNLPFQGLVHDRV